MPQFVEQNQSRAKKQVYIIKCLPCFSLCFSCDCLCGCKTTLGVKVGIELSVLNTWANNLTIEIYIQFSRENDTLLQTLCFCTQESFTDSIRNLLELTNMLGRVAGCKINSQNQQLSYKSIMNTMNKKSYQRFGRE